MDKVWVLQDEDGCLVGVFSTKERAAAVMAVIGDDDKDDHLTEEAVDEKCNWEQGDLYYCYVSRRNGLPSGSTGASNEFRHPTEPQVSINNAGTVFVWSPVSYEHARDVAVAKYQEEEAKRG